MKVILIHCTLLLLIIAIPQLAVTQSISVDHVDGIFDQGTLWADANIVVHLRLTNGTSDHFNPSNGFRLYSPDRATWSNFRGEAADSFKGMFMQSRVTYYGCNGSGADTVGFDAISFNSDAGLPAGYDDVAFKIMFHTPSDAYGSSICLDSSFYPPGGTWKWAALTGGNDVAPTWDGPHCWGFYTCASEQGNNDISASSLSELCGCCQGESGNVNMSPGGEVDIGDLTRLIDYLFITMEPLECVAEADVNSDSVIDIGDLTYLISHLFIDGDFPQWCL